MTKKALLTIALVLAAIAVPAASGSSHSPSTQVVPPRDPYAEVVPPGTSAQTPSHEAGGSHGAASGGLSRRAGKGAGRQLKTGFGDVLLVSDDDSLRGDVMDEAAGMNGSIVRLYTSWRRIAPSSPSPGFDATDPADPQYTWGSIDAAIRDASERGLTPLLMITDAPDWAEGKDRPSDAPAGTWKPNPKDVGDFATAIAKRYSGNFEDLPQVKDYMLWNEPNLPSNLTPQWNGKKPVAPTIYKNMLNAFYKSIHGASSGNLVVTAGTAPYGFDPGGYSMRPLTFWNNVLCVSDTSKPKAKKCKQKPLFDVLAHHPIDTSGGPTTSAIDRDDISTPDLHNLVNVLRIAERAHNVGTKGQHPVWATELWWESNPPDKFKTNPSLAVQAQWYAQALYLLWKQGASTVLFYQVRDDKHFGKPGHFTGSSYETGEYFNNGKPKPSATAVRFPFVAQSSSKSNAVIWGIAPESGNLVVTQQGPGPKKVATFHAKAGQIFTKTVKLAGKHELQAKVGSEKSLKYPLK